MSIDKFGAIISRGVGVGLIIMGVSNVASLLPCCGAASAGWTSYSPLGTNFESSGLDRTDYFVADHLFYPPAGQIVAGIVMILFSKRFGRWFARGLHDADTTGAT